MQKPPVESSAWLSHEELPIVDVAPKNLKVYSSMDLAISIGKGDYSVIITASTDEKGDLYILDVWRKQVDVDDVTKALISICQTDFPETVLIDDDNASKVFKNFALDAFRRYSIFVPLREMKTRGKEKEERAAAFSEFSRQGRIFLLRGDWNANLLQEVEGFPDTCRNDDQVDCLSLLGRYMARMTPVAGVKVEKLTEPIFMGLEPDVNGKLDTR